MRYILISGKRGSGKTTAGKLLKTMPLFKTHTIVHFADPLKEKYCKILNIDKQELVHNKEAHRQNLIDFGAEGRNTSLNYWSNMIKNNYEQAIIPDWRFLDEATVFPAEETITIRIEASKETRKSRGVIINIIDEDKSETQLDEHKEFDYIIQNNTNNEEELKNELRKVFEQ